MRDPHLTQARARQYLKDAGMTLKHVDGEYIVRFNRDYFGVPNAYVERTAYFTTDLEDAVNTGMHMSREQKRNPDWKLGVLSSRGVGKGKYR